MADITPISLIDDDEDNPLTQRRTVIEIEDSDQAEEPDDADDSEGSIYQRFDGVSRTLFRSTPDPFPDPDTPESSGLDDIRNIASFARNPYVNALWDDDWPRLDELVAKIHESNTLGTRLFSGMTEYTISDTEVVVKDAMRGLGEIARRLSKYNLGKGDREAIMSSENEENPAIKLALRHANLLTANPDQYTDKLGRSNCHARSLDINSCHWPYQSRYHGT
ncbi:hypothetical protein BDV97DRAFT_371732 [Delphinella strobiligena]|nr:hypothetical protein BDV97DRAFT_371732 [Delphinella strobiligena]